MANASLWHNVALVIGIITLAALIGAAVTAIMRNLPVWSYTWIGAGLTGLLVVLVLVGEDRDVVISPIVDVAALVLSLLAAVVSFGTAVSQGWQDAGLFSIGACATLGLSLCFFGVAGPFESNLGLLALLLGGVEFLLVYAYVRRSDLVRVVALVGVAAANVGVSWMVEWSFRSANPSREIDQFWYLVALLTVALLGGTLLGFPGRFAYRALGGLRDL